MTGLIEIWKALDRVQRLTLCRPVLVAISLVVLGVGCGSPEERASRPRATSIVDLEMLSDTVTVQMAELARADVTAALESDCPEGRQERCRLEDETRWLLRDSTLARPYIYTRSDYSSRDTARASYLPLRTGRTWVVVTNRTGDVADSTLLVVTPEG